MRKVFEISHGKTGSTSLCHAMLRLGFNCCHWAIPTSSDWMTHLLLGRDFNFDFLKEHEFVGNGIDRFYQHLDQYYPDAKFILLVRDESDWLDSYEYHLTGTRDLLQEPYFYTYMLSTYGSGNFDPLLWREAFRHHNHAVQQYFRGRPEKLLVMNVCEGDGYEVLCPFLGLPPLRDKFPMANVRLTNEGAAQRVNNFSENVLQKKAIIERYERILAREDYLPNLGELKLLLRTEDSVKVLKTGVFDGVSANVLLDEVFVNPGSEVHCVGLFPEQDQTSESICPARKAFAKNAEIFPDRRLHLYDGTSAEVLAWMIASDGYWETFDLIFLEDMETYFSDACQAWFLLRPSGLMVFGDCQRRRFNNVLSTDSIVLEAFLAAFSGRARLLHRDNALVLQKLSSLPLRASRTVSNSAQ